VNKFEELSAFMDGESGQPAESVIASVRNDAELQGAWRRYHLAADSLRGQLPAQVPAADLAARISKALDQQPTILSPRQDPRAIGRRLLKPAAGMAIAASVALVAIVGLRGIDQTGTGAPGVETVARVDTPAQEQEPARAELPEQSPQPVATSQLARTVSTGTEPAARDGYRQPTAQYSFNSYLINHNEYRTHSGVRGSMPYARIVAPYGNNQ